MKQNADFRRLPSPLRGNGWMVAHILVIEDDEGVSDVICDHLADQGYRCTTAATVEEARLVLARFRIDLVIADLVLPGTTTGAEIAHEARRHGVPAMIITAHSYVDEDPAIPVLRKPLRLGELLGVVEDLLARSPPPSKRARS
jgi:DNA-binding response OmpR family regulator